MLSGRRVKGQVVVHTSDRADRIPVARKLTDRTAVAVVDRRPCHRVHLRTAWRHLDTRLPSLAGRDLLVFSVCFFDRIWRLSLR